MGALRNLAMTGNDLGKSMARLSTGMRITSAGDDPAGLIVSENFRAQIAGIDQALRNNQDAVNYTKTAEGALDEVNKLLRDARSLAVGAANTGTMSAAQIQANQNQLKSIADSISRIASQTQFGDKKLLDGSSGVSANVTDPANVVSMTFGGSFNSAAINTDSLVTVDVSTVATQASLAGTVIYTNATDLVATDGSFSINGRTFTVSAANTVQDVLNMVNAASSTTGVSASLVSGTGIQLKATQFGTIGNFSLSDANGVIRTAGTSSATGTDAVASVIIDSNGATAGGLATVTFTGGKMGYNGLMLTDGAGNFVNLAANATDAAFTAGNLKVGSTQFQIGANVNQTAALAVGNYASSQLGANIVSGLNMSNLDITSISGATDALRVIDGAIGQISTARGDLGNFSRNVLESNMRSLGVAKENLAATESAIRDTDVAEEMTQFTKLQILQQSGMAMLAQANAAPQSVLSLLR